MRVKQACRELVISWNNVLLTRCCCYFKEDLTKYYTVTLVTLYYLVQIQVSIEYDL